MTTHAIKLVTAEQLFEMGDIGRCELVNGEIIKMAPAGAEHAKIAFEIAYRIKNFLVAHDVGGDIYTAEPGFTIARNPDTVRAPDVAFVGKDRAASATERYFDGAPDLAVEVVSPNDRLSELKAKANQWLTAGAVSVWVVNPQNQTIEVHHRNSDVKRYGAGEELRDEQALPGFALKIAEIFPAK